MSQLPDLRKTMGDAALRIAKEANYVNAGTVEFVADDEGNFFFSLGTASSGAGVRFEKRGPFNPLSYMDRMYACVP